jgi:nucleoid DNA-binding protein
MIRKSDIVATLAKEFNITKVLAGAILTSAVDQMKAELMKGSDVVIPQFFTLSVKDTMGRTVVIPSTGETADAKMYRRVRCKFSKKFRDEVKSV